MLQSDMRDLPCDPSHDGCQQATPEPSLIVFDLCISHVALKPRGPGLARDQVNTPWPYSDASQIVTCLCAQQDEL